MSLPACSQVVDFSISVQTVFYQQMIPDMGVELQQLNNGNSAGLAGLAVGCIFFIPFAVKYGRRPVYLVSTALLAASCWWTSRMTTYWELILTNFLIGLSGSINETTVQMTVRPKSTRNYLHGP